MSLDVGITRPFLPMSCWKWLAALASLATAQIMSRDVRVRQSWVWILILLLDSGVIRASCLASPISESLPVTVGS